MYTYVYKKYTRMCVPKEITLYRMFFTHMCGHFFTSLRVLLHLCDYIYVGFFYTYVQFFQHACVYASFRIRVIFVRIHVQNSRYSVTHICKNTRMCARHYTHACNSLFWDPISGY